MNCTASFCLVHDEGLWPSGDWQLCKNEATKVRFVPVATDCLVMVNLCEAHFDAWAYRDEAIRQLLGV